MCSWDGVHGVLSNLTREKIKNKLATECQVHRYYPQYLPANYHVDLINTICFKLLL